MTGTVVAGAVAGAVAAVCATVIARIVAGRRAAQDHSHAVRSVFRL